MHLTYAPHVGQEGVKKWCTGHETTSILQPGPHRTLFVTMIGSCCTVWELELTATAQKRTCKATTSIMFGQNHTARSLLLYDAQCQQSQSQYNSSAVLFCSVLNIRRVLLTAAFRRDFGVCLTKFDSIVHMLSRLVCLQRLASIT